MPEILDAFQSPAPRNSSVWPNQVLVGPSLLIAPVIENDGNF
jgi:hypothetical protein